MNLCRPLLPKGRNEKFRATEWPRGHRRSWRLCCKVPFANTICVASGWSPLLTSEKLASGSWVRRLPFLNARKRFSSQFQYMVLALLSSFSIWSLDRSGISLITWGGFPSKSSKLKIIKDKVFLRKVFVVLSLSTYTQWWWPFMILLSTWFIDKR